MTGYADAAEAILLDIEGTTTPVAYVVEVLFSFARERAAEFLRQHGQEPAVQEDLSQLRREYINEPETVPAWFGDEPTAAVPYIHYLIECDGSGTGRKSTALKSLQGKLWNQGYREGQLQSQLFADVKPALERWHAAGKHIYIFSSGSVQAQQLLFGHTEAGDLRPLLSGYFDTTTGSKKAPDSYRKITAAIGLPPERILFISDVTAELKAAQAAGMQTLLSCRPGNAAPADAGFDSITSFEAI
ncbi:Enolase-phosphatase E1 [Halomicronema hongdechloris C2206]|uniref:Enolase-phosphatase E1 n=1 Tax=Halomicronema hongdechloris C2206 TaxID=1641165 RepID=A0A1Z3HND8_9CYAN|nr:acireductone synthase [Halomicronema hongdechloris]ASC71828.1 Enolase-phosphatase E1 [Halomicronema hongdechloris C2206]